MSTILQLTGADSNLRSMMKGIKASPDLEETLSGHGPFTILAPVNLAFSQMKSSSFEEMLVPVNNTHLSEVLSNHILTEKKLVKDFYNGQKLKTLSGHELNVLIKDGEVTIDGAKILSKDRQGSNGVVHSINIVNMPKPIVAVPAKS